MNRYLAKALRIATTGVEVSATVCSLFVSVVQTRGASLWRFFVGAGAAGAGGVGTAITTYSFQGKAVAENADQDYITTVDWKYRRIQCTKKRLKNGIASATAATDRDRLLTNVVEAAGEAGALVPVQSTEHLPAMLLDETQPCCAPFARSLTSQILYLLDDTVIESVNRYLFLMLISTEIVTIPDWLFMLLFVTSNFVSTLFRATNAVYCGTREIANYYDEGSDSCYAGILKALARKPAAVKTIKIAGATEHTATHTVATALIIKYPFMFLYNYSPISKYFLIPSVSLGAILLLLLTFSQTWFFDAGETEKVMKLQRRRQPVDPDQAEEPFDIPVWLAKILYATMPMMPLVHGAETAVTILALNQIIDPVTPIVLATGGGILSVIGNWLSEKREADNQLAPIVYAEKIKRMDAQAEDIEAPRLSLRRGIN